MAIVLTIPEGDIELTNGKVVFISGAQHTRQKLASRFKFFLGEYFLDLRQGVPYYRDILVKNPDLNVIKSIFRKVILTTKGVESLTSYEMYFDEPNRRLTFSFEAQASTGPIIVGPNDRDFILDF